MHRKEKMKKELGTSIKAYAVINTNWKAWGWKDCFCEYGLWERSRCGGDIPCITIFSKLEYAKRFLRLHQDEGCKITKVTIK